MTRFARVQSAHRTHRQPEAATSWEEFQKQRNGIVDESQGPTPSNDHFTGIHRKDADKDRKITDAERKRLKKEKILKKMREDRESKGMVLLPEKVERKIYRIKKAMRSKGKTPAEIKEEIRKFRRKEELTYRKQCAKACLHCRQAGHKVADCPQAPQTGICYKCGASDHTSANCLKAAGGSFKFASCFVCGEKGHISRECPKNEKGLYPKGGGCRFCGSNKHKKQDCPERKSQLPEEEQEVVADVMVDSKSNVDDETRQKAHVTPDKRAKLIRF